MKTASLTRRLLLWTLCTAWPSIVAAGRPYVVLVSLDGFRYDYAERYHAGHLQAIRDAGASAASLIPVFPSLTFPNHTSIITGLYAEHHGIVANSFYDPGRRAAFSMSRTAADGSWYGGKPLWVLAEEQDVKAATMFWPGSDGEIQGVRPSYWRPFDPSVPDQERLDRVLGWLRLPEPQRPHFVTLYIGDVDTAGHRFGPDAPETAQAVEKVDQLMGRLWERLQSLHLPLNLIIVSDHGMQTVDRGEVDLRRFADLRRVRVVGGGSLALIYAPSAELADHAYRELKGKSPMFDVYRRREIPREWHYSENARIGDVLVVAKQACLLADDAGNRSKSPRPPAKGMHGYDPAQFKTMHGIFYAIGPNIRARSRIGSFENVNIYPFIAQILGLNPPADLDGSAAMLKPLYRP